MDALALEGVVYERAYATNFWTLPSHASLLTGLYSSQAGATSETGRLPAFNTTLAEVLKKADYKTAAFICNAWISKERGFSQGFEEFYEMWRSENKPEFRPQPGWTEWATVKKATEWLEKQKTKSNPFLLFINLNCAHMPYNPPGSFLSIFIKPN